MIIPTKAWDASIANVRKGKDLVSSILSGVYSSWPCMTGYWPCGPEPEACGSCGSCFSCMCQSCHIYNIRAPEVAALNIIRQLAANPVLGSWDERIDDGWCASHSRDEAVALLELAKKQCNG